MAGIWVTRGKAIELDVSVPWIESQVIENLTDQTPSLASTFRISEREAAKRRTLPSSMSWEKGSGREPLGKKDNPRLRVALLSSGTHFLESLDRLT